MADLYLHSMAEFWPIISPMLDAVDVRSTIEIGVEYGTMSDALIQRAKAVGGQHIGIDPTPRADMSEVFDEACCQLVNQPSLACLGNLPAVDACFVDGDHNYYTVLYELRLIRDVAMAAGKPFPLVFAHDVGWPCARRDFYYAPERIPAEYLRTHSYELGVRPGVPRAKPGGLRGEGAFAVALREGGPKNGVLTAVEDFLAETSGVQFANIPAVLGLGVLCPDDMMIKLEPLIAPYRDNPLLQTLEQNRLDLFVRVLDWQDREALKVG